jgi:thiol-disulfide isomerase/thioredoxin
MPLRIGTPLPDLSGATEWLGANEDEALAAGDGRPTLVHFWSRSCELCKEKLPSLTELRNRIGGERLRVVAIHMPRYPTDTDVAAVRETAALHGVTEPCAVDNMHRLRDAFGNDQGFVPAYYLFDADGNLRSYAAGERGLQIVTSALERLLSRDRR